MKPANCELVKVLTMKRFKVVKVLRLFLCIYYINYSSFGNPMEKNRMNPLI